MSEKIFFRFPSVCLLLNSGIFFPPFPLPSTATTRFQTRRGTIYDSRFQIALNVNPSGKGWIRLIATVFSTGISFRERHVTRRLGPAEEELDNFLAC